MGLGFTSPEQEIFPTSCSFPGQYPVCVMLAVCTAMPTAFVLFLLTLVNMARVSILKSGRLHPIPRHIRSHAAPSPNAQMSTPLSLSVCMLNAFTPAFDKHNILTKSITHANLETILLPMNRKALDVQVRITPVAHKNEDSI